MQRVNLRIPRPEAVRIACRCPLVTAIHRPFWHACGTNANLRGDAELPLARLVDVARDGIPDSQHGQVLS